MEPNQRDTPLRRFNTFWWGLGLFVVFAVASLIFSAVSPKSEDAQTDRRRERTKFKAATVESQKAVLDAKVPVTVVYDELGKSLVAAKPTASTKPVEQ